MGCGICVTDTTTDPSLYGTPQDKSPAASCQQSQSCQTGSLGFVQDFACGLPLCSRPQTGSSCQQRQTSRRFTQINAESEIGQEMDAEKEILGC